MAKRLSMTLLFTYIQNQMKAVDQFLKFFKTLLAANVLHGIFHICSSPPFNNSLCWWSSEKPVWNLFFQASLMPFKSSPERQQSRRAHPSIIAQPPFFLCFLYERAETWFQSFVLLSTLWGFTSPEVHGGYWRFPCRVSSKKKSKPRFKADSRLDPENPFTKRQHENCKFVRKGEKSLLVWHILVWWLSQGTSVQLKGSLSKGDK